MGTLPVGASPGSKGGFHAGMLEKGRRLIAESADIVDFVDVGGGGFANDSRGFEVSRLGFVLDAIASLSKEVRVSISTSSPAVATAAAAAGASLINDVSEHTDAPPPGIYTTWVGVFSDQGTLRGAELIGRVEEFSRRHACLAEQAGIEEAYIDPGIGVSTFEQDLDLFASLELLARSCLPMVVDVDGGEFPEKLLKLQGTASLDATLAMAAWAMLAGASVIRSRNLEEVNDVARVIGAKPPARAKTNAGRT